MSTSGGSNTYSSHVSFFQKAYTSMPHFDDLFDEETFYVFALVVTISAIIIAFIMSRFITLKEVSY